MLDEKKIRKKAETIVNEKQKQGKIKNPTEETMTELQIHQVELEMQNKQLREMQLQLEESRRKYHDLFDNAPFGYCYIDEDMNILELNSTLIKMLDIDNTDNYKKFSDFINPSFQDTFYIHLNKLKNQKVETKSYLEVKLKKINGYLWTSLQMTKKNKKYKIAVIDISARKITETELRKSENKFRNIFNNSNDAFYLHKIDRSGLPGKFLEVNRRASEMLNYTKKELLKLTPQDIDIGYKKDLVNLPKIMDELKYRKKITFETIHLDKNGKEIFVEVSAFQFKLDDEKVILSVARDITDRKKAEEKLKKNYSLLETIINTLPGSLIVIDRNYNILTANSSKFRLDLAEVDSSQDLIGKKCHKVFFNNEKTCPWCAVKQVMKTGDPIVYFTTKDDPREIKTGKSFQVFVAPIKNSSDKIEGIVEYSVDVSQIRKAQLKAEEASKAKSNFLANMSHEFRTPLNSIIGFTDIILNADLEDEQRIYMENVNNSAKSLLSLVNDILDFSKIESGKVVLEEKDVNLIDLLEQNIELVKHKIIEKKIDFIIDLDPRLPKKVVADPFRLKQVITNLLSNAVKFTEEGEIILRAAVIEKDNRILKVRIGIKDTGIGISPENQKSIFESFTQADISTTRKFGGTGLGLNISNKILEKMGTELKLKSEKELGSLFYFDLDLEISENLTYPKVETLKLDSALIIENNKKQSEVLSKLLKFWGIDSSTIRSVKNISPDINAKNLDLIFVNIPPTEEEFNLLKDLNRVIKIPFIYMLDSIRQLNEMKDTFVDNGKFKLVKPVKITELADILIDLSENNEKIKSELKNRRNKKVLIVEDNKINVDIIKLYISKIRNDFDIFEAYDGEQAVSKYKKVKPDIIFMDVQMPKKDGFDATQDIRSIEDENYHVPIVAVTAGIIEEEKEKCIKAGMDDYITKPISQNVIEKMLNKLLFKKQY
mgnify:CR=1 FL=1